MLYDKLLQHLKDQMNLDPLQLSRGSKLAYEFLCSEIEKLANKPTEEKKTIFVGMMRAPWNEFTKRFGPSTGSGVGINCPVCNKVGMINNMYDHWEAGHFDEPVYKDV